MVPQPINKILFITNSLQVGGVETLLVRMSNWLADNGYEIKILSQKFGQLQNKFDSRIEVKIDSLGFRLLFIPLFAKVITKNKFFKDIQIIYSFRPRTFWISTIIKRFLSSDVKIFTGVYHPREYWLDGTNDYTTRFYSDLFNNYFDDHGKLFMSSIVRTTHESFFKKIYTNANILPLAIDSSEFEKVVRMPDKNKIISIGRLINFKSYNLYMIDVIKDLLNEGYNITYEIYGDGPDKSVIQKKISSCRLDEHIKLMGEIDYFKMPQVLKDAYLFIGMGTAIIEAAYAKVPSVVCIESLTTPYSYGYLYEMKDYNFGELDPLNSNFKDVKDLIINVLSLSKSEYDQEMEKTYQYALKYKPDIIMQNFCSIINQKEYTSNHFDYPTIKYYQFISNYIYKFISKILLRLTNGKR